MAQEYRLRLKLPAPHARRVSPQFNLNPRTVFRALAQALRLRETRALWLRVRRHLAQKRMRFAFALD